MKYTVAPRGKFRTLLDPATGAPPAVRLFGCAVATATSSGGKSYVALAPPPGDQPGLAAARAVDESIRAAQKPLGFSPLRAGRLHVKVPARGVRYETADGEETPAWPLGAGATVDVEIRLGAFGAFGYCWLLARVKPSAL